MFKEYSSNNVKNQFDYLYIVCYFYFSNNSVAPINQLLVFLRVCATGSHLSLVGDFAGMHYSTVSRIVKRVANALATRAKTFIKMPRTEEERNKNNLLFYEKARFPRVIGAIDCTHIKIQSPGKHYLFIDLFTIEKKKHFIHSNDTDT